MAFNVPHNCEMFGKKELSMEEKRTLIQSAMNDGPSDQPVSVNSPYVVDVYDEYIICSKEGKFFKMSYSVLDGGVQLGTPVEVTRTVTYEENK